MPESSWLEASDAQATHYPYTEARSDSGSQALLAALLASSQLDEVSNAEDFEAVNRHIRGRGHTHETGKIQSGLAFWLYPTGLYGPYHVDEESGEVKKHGELITIELGVDVGYACRRARAALRTEGIGHTHISLVDV